MKITKVDIGTIYAFISMGQKKRTRLFKSGNYSK